MASGYENQCAAAAEYQGTVLLYSLLEGLAATTGVDLATGAEFAAATAGPA